MNELRATHFQKLTEMKLFNFADADSLLSELRKDELKRISKRRCA